MPVSPSPVSLPDTSPPLHGIANSVVTLVNLGAPIAPQYRQGMELVIHETPEATAASAADRVADLVGGSEGTFTLGFAGGSTPQATYQAMRGRVSTWERVEGWLSDERWVPPNHPRSNGRMAAEALMDHVEARFLRPLRLPACGSPWSSGAA